MVGNGGCEPGRAWVSIPVPEASWRKATSPLTAHFLLRWPDLRSCPLCSLASRLTPVRSNSRLSGAGQGVGIFCHKVLKIHMHTVKMGVK